MSLADILFRTAQLWPERVAMHEGAIVRSWGEVLDRTRRLATALNDTVAAPDRIALLGQNSPAFLEAMFAVAVAGRELVPLNSRLSASEFVDILTACRCGIVCFDRSQASVAETLCAQTNAVGIFLGDARHAPEWALAADRLIENAAPADPPVTGSEAIWAILPTGGTTGKPKGVMLSHRALAATVKDLVRDVRLEDGPRLLNVAPLFHMAGLSLALGVTTRGGTHGFLPVFSMDELLARLARDRATVVNLIPTMINWLVAREDLGDYDLSALRTMTYGAAPITHPVLRRLMELFPSIRLTQFFGQTEACGAIACLLHDEHQLEGDGVKRLRSVGRAIGGKYIEILDEQGGVVPRGTYGEICARTDGLFSGYLGHPELTAHTLRDGWLHTGDGGHMDDDGFIYLGDRMKDMIVTGGENVSASEVENVIAQHVDVIQVAVVGAKDDVWGERVHAFVVVRDHATLDADAVVEFCRAQLTGYKCPRTITVQHAELPLSAVGKVRKDMLRALLNDAA